ncbi:hypothetical protein CN272_01195 [Bacillus anthracis]|nr:hypothetical protein [Bacillus tropicus]PEU92627.1 hypothetical protein CN415_14125 [Bacillus cereus]PFC90728.1 hypothetical protein CN272_01195 [Bacillus anthracis]PFT27323.1 hypothetical protein COK52_00610 [Bacillus thuringiensis]MBG9923450.1 hypothetical protein [Bacillus tropicus]
MNEKLFNVLFILKSASLLTVHASFHFHPNIIKVTLVQVSGRCLEVSFFYDFYHQLCNVFLLLHNVGFLYQALWIHLDLSIGVVILLEHPAIFRQNVVNKNHSINFFK